MPLFKKKVLEKIPNPESLDDKEEIFYCELTGEIFKDFNAYAERTILYSSMVWTCSMTGKSNLTYSEALQSEENAKKTINDFPVELKVPVLYLANMTQRRGIYDMADDVFAYIKDRYFIGENVEVNIENNKWKNCHIIQIKAPNDEEDKKNGVNSESTGKHFYPLASAYKYAVELFEEKPINDEKDADEESSISNKDNDEEEKSDNDSEGGENDEDENESKEGEDDENESNEGEEDEDGSNNGEDEADENDNNEEEEIEETVERELLAANKIRRIKGSLSKDKMKLFLKQHVEINSNGIFIIKENTINDFGINKIEFNQIFDGPLPNFEVSTKRVKQETLFKYLTKNNAQQSNQTKKETEEKTNQKEEDKEPPIDMNKEIKEWHKPKEDLELEDQKKMPNILPVEMKIPLQYFGDMLMITEFINSFDEVLLIKDFFPDGLTLELVKNAFLEKELAGSFTNLLQMLLNAVFKLQEEEASQASTEIENKSGKTLILDNIKQLLYERVIPDFGYDNNQDNDNLSLEDATKFATAAVNYCKNYQGLSVGELPLYSLTVTEILRLHLLTSGAQINYVGSKWRYQQRGGYISQDDPGLDLCLKEPDILQMLSTENVVNLSLDQKVKLITCLVNQILTYADIRDIIEERLVNSRQAKLQLKLAISTERRRQQELSSTKTKLKKDTENTSKFIADEMERLNKENETKIIEYEKEVEKLLKGSSDFQTFLGFDRAYRKYIKCENVPGIFIECNSEYVGECQTQLTKQISYELNGSRAKLIKHIINVKINTASNKENQPENEVINGYCLEKQNYDELYMCSTDPSNCIVHSSKNNNKWFFIHKQEELETLIDCLNMRGLRESELKQTLLESKEILMSIVSKTPGHILNPNVEDNPNYKNTLKSIDVESTNFGYSSDTEPSLVEHNVLLDLILKLETKIRTRNVSALNVENVDKWRDMLMKEDYENFANMFKATVTNGSTSTQNGSRSSTPDIKQKEPGEYLHQFLNKDKLKITEIKESQLKALQCLSLALVQISQGVDLKNLKQPLGSRKRPKSRKDNNKKISLNLLDKWQQSLLQSTSFSQIFLHYALFENCIILSKCRICRNQNDTHKMLFCDKCNLGHHIYCQKPALKEFPTGDWYCWTCSSQYEKTEQTRLPRKRRRIFRDESEDDENLEDDFEHQDANDESDGMKLDICVTCNSAGELLSCAKCPNAYHVECVVPPLRRHPRGKWYCHKCKERYDKDVKRNNGIVVHDTAILINRRRCATRARTKIRGFIKTLRRSTDSDESGSEMTSLSRRSLRRIAETRDDLPLHNATLQELLTDIMKHKDSWPFIRPVQKNEVPDYYEIINKPMDFGTIKYKLNMGEYKCDSDFMEDAFLVFENCNTYNNSEAEVYKCGVQLCKYFEKKCKEVGLKIPQYLLEYDDSDELAPNAK